MNISRYFPLIFTLLCTGAFAQDLHFSQAPLHPLHFNPAQTGPPRSDLRASAIYRSQWRSVPVAYSTIGLGVDKKFWASGPSTLSAGLLVQHDKAGDAGLRWTQVGLGVGAARNLGGRHCLSAGFGWTLVQRGVDISRLKFQNQWLNDQFHPDWSNKENFNQSSGLRSSLSAGLLWRFQAEDSRFGADAGVGVFHLNRPDMGLGDAPATPLPRRWTLMANCAVPTNEFLDFVVFAVAQRMGSAGENIVGAGARFWMEPGKKALQCTLATRFGDALIPAVQMEFQNWTVGVSYDWNTSGFETATAGRGGFEVAVVYRSLEVPPVKKFKSCPVF